MNEDKKYLLGFDLASKNDKSILLCNFHQEGLVLTDELAKSFIGKPFVNERGVPVGHIINAELTDDKENIRYAVEMHEHFEVPK